MSRQIPIANFQDYIYIVEKIDEINAINDMKAFGELGTSLQYINKFKGVVIIGDDDPDLTGNEAIADLELYYTGSNKDYDNVPGINESNLSWLVGEFNPAFEEGATSDDWYKKSLTTSNIIYFDRINNNFWKIIDNTPNNLVWYNITGNVVLQLTDWEIRNTENNPNIYAHFSIVKYTERILNILNSSDTLIDIQGHEITYDNLIKKITEKHLIGSELVILDQIDNKAFYSVQNIDSQTGSIDKNSFSWESIGNSGFWSFIKQDITHKINLKSIELNGVTFNNVNDDVKYLNTTKYNKIIYNQTDFNNLVLETGDNVFLNEGNYNMNSDYNIPDHVTIESHPDAILKLINTDFNNKSIFNNSNIRIVKSAIINTNKVIIAYCDNGDSANGKCIIAEFNNNIITYGNEYTFTTGNCNTSHGISISALENDRAVVTYFDWDNGYLNSKVVNISGTVITYGTQYNINWASSVHKSISIDANRVLVMYFYGITNITYSRILNISGNSITNGPAIVISNNTNAYINLSYVIKIDDNKVYYLLNEFSSVIGSIIGDIVGDVITIGTLQNEGGNLITPLDNNKVMITEINTVKIATISGTIITFNTPTIFHPDIIASELLFMLPINSTKALIFHTEHNDYTVGLSVVAEFINGAFRFGNSNNFSNNLVNYNTYQDDLSAVIFSDNNVIVSYKKVDNNGENTAYNPLEHEILLNVNGENNNIQLNLDLNNLQVDNILKTSTITINNIIKLHIINIELDNTILIDNLGNSNIIDILSNIDLYNIQTGDTFVYSKNNILNDTIKDLQIPYNNIGPYNLNTENKNIYKKELGAGTYNESIVNGFYKDTAVLGTTGRGFTF
jgi:hypothetical protein